MYVSYVAYIVITAVYTHVRVGSLVGARTEKRNKLMTSLVNHEAADLNENSCSLSIIIIVV